MKKIAFVLPWFGEKIPGGAEMEARDLIKHLAQAGIEIEILTTCVKEFSSDWNINHYKPGTYQEMHVTVRRFPIRKRNTKSFDAVNAKLMQGKPVAGEEEQIFLQEMINSPELYTYIREKQEKYQAFVYIPYMFGTTYYGIKECPKKAILIPCFHDEAYFYLKAFKELYSKAAAIVYNAEPEYELANKYYDLENVRQVVMGIGMDTKISGNADRFRNKYHIQDDYILYAGRKDLGKNVHTLVTYFAEYKKRTGSKMKLILIGGGKLEIPGDMEQEIMDLGFVDIQDKYDAYSGAALLCQPSQNESFSLVIMESWLCGRPVLVHDKCKVTKNFVQESNGGLYFADYFEFEGAVEYIRDHADTARQMGQNGCMYVREKFEWDTIVKKYIELFENISC